MISWAPFTYDEITYDLSHLHPKLIQVIQPATGDKPARVYNVQIIYGLHTFTHGLKKGEAMDESLRYCDSREYRVFDFQHYALSRNLPEIVEGLARRKCYHTGKGNFFVIELTGENGQRLEYEVYFELSRASRKGILNLYVQSAYVRDAQHKEAQPKRKPIGFLILLFNIQNNKPIKTPT